MKNTTALLLFLAAQTLALAAADFEVKDDAEFKRLFAPDAKIEKLATGMGFTEGPVWNTAGGYLIFSDIPTNELKKWTAKDGVTTFRKPSNNANGNTIDLFGKLVSAEHGARRVSITDTNGVVTTLVDQFDGKKLNSPNDVVVKRDGSVWFTDPDYGLAGRPKEQAGNYVFRYDPRTKAMAAVVKDFDKPNGLCFSPDEKRLFVADSGTNRHIRAFDVQPDGSLTNVRVFCKIDQGGPDGIRSDVEGRVWSSSGNGVQVFGPNGALIVKINLPESGANLCFGGAEGRTLFVTARKSLYAVPTLTLQARRPLKIRY